MNELTKIKDQITGKQRNILRLVSLISQRDPISQKELAQISGLQTSTTSVLLKELKKKKVVVVAGKGDSQAQGGKKAELLQLNGEYGVFTGLYIKEDKICACTINLQGRIDNYSEIAIDNFSSDWLSNAITDIVRKDKANYRRYRGVGISVQSTVTLAGDIIIFPEFNIELKKIIRSSVKNIVVVVENDVNCSAYHFYNFYRGKYSSLVAIMFYFGPFAMGSGIILHDTPYRGINGTAGEMWREENPLLEKILQKYAYDLEKVKHSQDFEVFIKKIREYILFIARFLDVEAVVLCGDLPKLGEDVLCKLRDAVSRVCTGVTVEIADSFNSPIIGAAEIATELFLSKQIQKLK